MNENIKEIENAKESEIVNDNENWHEVIQYFADLQKQSDQSKQKLASELMSDFEKKDKRKSKIILVLIIAIAFLSFFYIWQWTAYDYVSQDGNGQNYYNSNVEGAILNGSTDQEKEG